MPNFEKSIETVAEAFSVISLYPDEIKITSKIAAFDLDDTLTSGQALTLYPGVEEKLLQLHNEGYTIVVFSNQKKSHIGDKKLKDKLQKIKEILPVPVFIFCAREEDEYRKPNIEMIKLIPEEKEHSTTSKIEFFVGDAAGREFDFSDCDKMFAEKAGIKFYTPEEFFNPFPVIDRNKIPSTLKRKDNIRILTMVILVGYPASGKTLYSKNILKDFTHINRDELKTMDKCFKVCKQELKNNNNVVIDNLNGTREQRIKFIEIANEMEARVVLIHINPSMRQAQGWNKNRERKVPDVVFFTYRKNFELPSLDEGIDEIYTILD